MLVSSCLLCGCPLTNHWLQGTRKFYEINNMKLPAGYENAD